MKTVKTLIEIRHNKSFLPATKGCLSVALNVYLLNRFHGLILAKACNVSTMLMMKQAKVCVLSPIKRSMQQNSSSTIISKLPPLQQPPSGVLLQGQPGTGKTMLAQAIDSDANVPLISMEPSAVESRWFGQSEKHIKASFSLAAKLAPCIVFIDELNAIAGTRSDDEQSYVNSTKAQPLSELGGVHRRERFYRVIGATNRTDLVDPALRKRTQAHASACSCSCAICRWGPEDPERNVAWNTYLDGRKADSIIRWTHGKRSQRRLQSSSSACYA